MSKTTRQTFQLFGGSGPSGDFGQFGSAAGGSPVTSKSIPTIQQLAAWLNGWQDAVALGQAPYLNDMNGLLYVFAYEIFYGLQEGIAEWDNGTTYYIGSIVKRTGTFELYGSIIDSNTGNALPAQVTDSNWQFLGYLSDLPIARLNAKNIVVNGGFEIWQRGTSFSSPNNNAYTADRWQVAKNGSPTYTISREASVVDTGNYSMKLLVSSASASSRLYVQQKIENFGEYKGKQVSVSVRVKCDTASAIRVSLEDGVSAANSSYHTGDNTWQTLRATLNVSASATTLLAEVGMVASNDQKVSTSYFDGLMLINGAVSVAYVPEDPQQAFARCQRYYEIITTTPVNQMPIGGYNANSYLEGGYRFAVAKAAVPSITLSSLVVDVYQFAVTNLSAAPVDDSTNWSVDATSPDISSVYVRLIRTPASGSYGIGKWSCQIVAEANP